MGRTTSELWLAAAAAALTLGVAACGASEEPAEEASRAAEETQNAAEETAEDAADAAEAAAEEVQEAADAAAEDAEDAAEEASEEAEDAADEAGDAAASAGDKMRNAAGDMKNAAGDAADAAEEGVRNAAASASDAMKATAASATAAASQVSDEVKEAYAKLTGDAAAGKRVFTKCMACHVADKQQNRVGPHLNGVVGREAGSVEGFNYSDANANSGIVWTEPVLFEYLEDPRGYLPGTKMVFAGLPKEQDRADVIAYLKSVAE